MTSSLEELTDKYVAEASETIQANISCFVAQWVLQNPSNFISDYTMVYQHTVNGMKFSMEKK